MDEVATVAGKITKALEADLFIYNGNIERTSDLKLIQSIHKNQKNPNCMIILVTNGGDADAAYKIIRYVQDKYDKLTILVSGLCKSAGTLMAMGAHELIFTPYGELGPLDVQTVKEDKLSGLHSGLNISEALQTLERRAAITYNRTIGEILNASVGIVSFQTASKAASEVIAALYAPIFAQIDPEDVGGRARSMRIAIDYGKRLDVISGNLKPGSVNKLAETYSSHSFVIDEREAKALFKRVRSADSEEMALVEALGEEARWSIGMPNGDPVVRCLSVEEKIGDAQNENKKKTRGRADGQNRGNSKPASKQTGSEAGARNTRRRQRIS